MAVLPVLTTVTALVSSFINAPFPSAVQQFSGVAEPLMNLMVTIMTGQQDDSPLNRVDQNVIDLKNSVSILSSDVFHLPPTIQGNRVIIAFNEVERDIKSAKDISQQLLNGSLTPENYRQQISPTFENDAYSLYDLITRLDWIYNRNLVHTVSNITREHRPLLQQFSRHLMTLWLQAVTVELAMADPSTRVQKRQLLLSRTDVIKDKLSAVDAWLEQEWKSLMERDADDVMRRCRHESNEATRVTLTEMLEDKYPDMNWVPVVYDPVAEYDNQCMFGHFIYYKFQFHGKNVLINAVPKADCGPGNVPDIHMYDITEEVYKDDMYEVREGLY